MVEYIKEKKLENEFERLRLSQDDLKKVGLLFKRYVQDTQPKELNIDIVNLDGEEIITSHDPEIFSDDIPLKSIRSVKFSLRFIDTKTRVELDLPAQDKNYAKLYVRSNDDIQASGIFHEFVNELKSYEVWGRGFKNFAHGIIGRLLFSTICALSVFSVFDIPLDLISSWNPDLKKALLPIVFIGWVCVIVAFFEGGDFVNKILDKAIPAIEFTGKLGTASSKSMMLLMKWITYIFLPIILNVISAFIKDHIQYIINISDKLF